MNIAVLGTLAAGGGGGGFDISSISKLIWLDASNAGSITQSEGKVSAWNDLSGNGRHVSQAEADYQPAIASNLITFDGSNDYLSNSSPFMWSANGVAIFFVLSTATGLSGNILCEGKSGDDTPVYRLYKSSGRDYLYARADDQPLDQNIFNINLTGGNHYDLHLLTVIDTGDGATGYVNGFTRLNDSYSRSGYTVTLNNFALGAWIRASSSFTACTIAELIVTTDTIGAANRTDIEDYLLSRWRINLVPGMTSYSAPYGTASAETEANDSNAAWYAFNRAVGDKWTANGTTGWLAYEFPSATTVREYTVVGCITVTTVAPKNWTFDGYDGADWVTLDTQTNQTGWTLGEKRTFSISNTTAYTKYRINITANNGNASYVGVCELEMFSKATS